MNERERYLRMCAIFHATAELSPTGRDAELAAACRDSPSLLLELRTFFAAYDRESRSAALNEVLPEPGPEVTPPERVGTYRVLERLGAGGMGVVHRAEQERDRKSVV